MIAVTNTIGSSLAREADAVMYTHAGPEICVAATKTFATQMAALHLVALYLAQIRGAMFPVEIGDIVNKMRELPGQVRRTLALSEQIRGIAEEIRDARDVLFIGRHTGYPAALEGALKLKELSYVHAEGYPAGELKHGPIALVEDGVPVVASRPSATCTRRSCRTSRRSAREALASSRWRARATWRSSSTPTTCCSFPGCPSCSRPSW